MYPFKCTFKHYKALVVGFGFQEVIGKILIDFCLRAWDLKKPISSEKYNKENVVLKLS